jgi:hypothetical protein
MPIKIRIRNDNLTKNLIVIDGYKLKSKKRTPTDGKTSPNLIEIRCSLIICWGMAKLTQYIAQVCDIKG